MKKQINPTIKAHLIRGAFYLLLLVAVCAIPFALAQRNTASKNTASKNAVKRTVSGVAPATTTSGAPRAKGKLKSASSTHGFSHARGTVPRPVVNAPAGTACWYDFTVGTDTFVPGVDDIGSHCDDCDTPITVPFSVTLYGQTFTTAQAGSNGHLTFGVDNPSFGITCPPPFGINETTEALAPYWGDQCTGACASIACSTCGIFTTTTGTTPNRVFYIEWRTQYYNQAQTVNYEIALYESGDPPFKFIYNTITPAGAPNDSELVVGQKFDETCYTVFGCDTNGGTLPPVSSGQALTAVAAATPTPTPPPQCSPWATASPYPTTIVRYGFVQTATHFYVFGGVSDGTRVNNVNRMNLATGTWEPRASMPFTSEAPTCALMEATGIVYCAEGDTGNGFASYNIATDTWSSLAADPFVANHYGSSSGALNGKVFVVGGTTSFSSGNWVYDVATNTWSLGTSAPNSYLLAGYHQQGQFLYVVGGWTGGGPTGLTTTTRLDMSSAPGVWETGPAFTQARADFGLAYDASTNKLYAMGGDADGGGFFDSTNLVDELCLEGWPGGVWSSSTPNLPSPTRQANQAGFYGGGNIWSVGGLNGATFTFLPDVLWRPSCAAACATASPTPTPTPTATGSPSCTPGWRIEPPILAARSFASGAVANNAFYVLSGFNGSTPYEAETDFFNGSVWATGAPIPVPHSQSRATSIGNVIYVPGGFNSIQFGGPLDLMQIYNTTTNTWSNGMNLPAARSGGPAVAFNNLVYVIGGYNPVGTGHNEVFIYDPVSNSYTNGAPMPAGQGNMPGVLLNGEIYVVGGGTAPGAQFAYNPTANTWRTIAPLPTTSGMCQAGGGFVVDNELWIVGCLGLPINQQVWIYNPGTNAWRAGPQYNANHEGGSATSLFNARGYVAGGGAGGGATTTVESTGPCQTASPTPTATFTPTPTATATFTPTPTATATATIAPRPTPTPRPRPTPPPRP